MNMIYKINKSKQFITEIPQKFYYVHLQILLYLLYEYQCKYHIIFLRYLSAKKSKQLIMN